VVFSRALWRVRRDTIVEHSKVVYMDKLLCRCAVTPYVASSRILVEVVGGHTKYKIQHPVWILYRQSVYKRLVGSRSAVLITEDYLVTILTCERAWYQTRLQDNEKLGIQYKTD
jgi:hypothetical protein